MAETAAAARSGLSWFMRAVLGPVFVLLLWMLLMLFSTGWGGPFPNYQMGVVWLILAVGLLVYVWFFIWTARKRAGPGWAVAVVIASSAAVMVIVILGTIVG